jgi:hypothetical protein
MFPSMPPTHPVYGKKPKFLSQAKFITWLPLNFRVKRGIATTGECKKLRWWEKYSCSRDVGEDQSKGVPSKGSVQSSIDEVLKKNADRRVRDRAKYPKFSQGLVVLFYCGNIHCNTGIKFRRFSID